MTKVVLAMVVFGFVSSGGIASAVPYGGSSGVGHPLRRFNACT